MATGQFKHEADLLHPLATLHWQQCHTWRNVSVIDCAVLHDRVAILEQGGWRSGDVLHISSTDLLSWTISTLSYYGMSLTIYQSKFVLVGGRHPSTGEATNVLLTSDTELQWKETLPPMPTNRYLTSSVTTKSPQVLVVAGGADYDGYLDVVEVLIGDYWMTVESLPTPCYCMHSVFHDGNLYFIGGVLQGDDVYTCSCSSLMSSCEESTNSTTTDSPIWRTFKAPGGRTAAVSYSSYLVSIDGECVIRAYSNVTQSWLETTSTGNTHQQYTEWVAAAVLPTGELVYAHRYGGVYKVKLIISGSLDRRFSFDQISNLEALMGVHIVSVLANDRKQLLSSSQVKTRRFLRKVPMPDPKTSPHEYVRALMTRWIEGYSHRPPTWRELLHMLQDMGQAELRQQIEVFMKEGGVDRDAHNSMEPEESQNVHNKDFSLTDYPPLPKIIDDEEKKMLTGFSADDEVSVAYKGESGSLDWEEYGLTLLFERSDYSSEPSKYPVHVLAGESGAFRYPERVELASPIYHIDCPKQLPAPVTIRIKHSVPEEDILYLCFMTCSEDQPPYDYSILDGGNFTSSHAEISVKSFSFYSLGFFRKYIVKSILSMRERSYATSLHCSVQPALDSSGYLWNVYVSVVKNCFCFTQSIHKYIKEKYSEDVKEIASEIVDFAATKDRITVTTSYEHSLEEEVQLDSCKSPSIKKTAISRYVAATLPHIKYSLRVPFKLEGETLKIKITLEGLEEPENYLRLHLTVPSSAASPLRRISLSSEEMPGAHSEYAFTMKNLRVLNIGPDKKVHLIEEISPQWKEAGDLLGLRISHTRVIEEIIDIV